MDSCFTRVTQRHILSSISACRIDRQRGYTRENRDAFLAANSASTHIKSSLSPPHLIPIAWLGMQVSKAPLCLLPLELKKHPYRSTLTGLAAASSVAFVQELWHNIPQRNNQWPYWIQDERKECFTMLISYNRAICDQQSDRDNERLLGCQLAPKPIIWGFLHVFPFRMPHFPIRLILSPRQRTLMLDLAWRLKLNLCFQTQS